MQSPRSQRHALRIATHFLNHAGQLAAHILQRIEQQAHFITALAAHRCGQLARSHILSQFHGGLHRLGDGPRHGKTDGSRNQYHQHQRAQQPVTGQRKRRFFRLLRAGRSVQLQRHDLACTLGQPGKSAFRFTGKNRPISSAMAACSSTVL